MPSQTANWTRDPRVASILQSIRRNPPSIKNYAHGLNSSWRDGLAADQREYDRSDDRVVALRKISNEYFLAAEREGGRDGALAFCANAPSVDAVIEGATVAEKVAA